MEVAVSNLQSEVPIDARDVRSFVRRLARACGAAEDEVSLAFVGRETMRDLNRRYLGRDRPTDVLSFSLGAGSGPPGRSTLGEIVICAAEAASRAARGRRDLWTEMRRLIIHGFLHLRGMEHPEDRDAAGGGEMEREERRLRRLLLGGRPSTRRGGA